MAFPPFVNVQKVLYVQVEFIVETLLIADKRNLPCVYRYRFPCFGRRQRAEWSCIVFSIASELLAIKTVLF
jgi:hypothetical protein